MDNRIEIFHQKPPTKKTKERKVEPNDVTKKTLQDRIKTFLDQPITEHSFLDALGIESKTFNQMNEVNATLWIIKELILFYKQNSLPLLKKLRRAAGIIFHPDKKNTSTTIMSILNTLFDEMIDGIENGYPIQSIRGFTNLCPETENINEKKDDNNDKTVYINLILKLQNKQFDDLHKILQANPKKFFFHLGQRVNFWSTEKTFMCLLAECKEKEALSLFLALVKSMNESSSDQLVELFVSALFDPIVRKTKHGLLLSPSFPIIHFFENPLFRNSITWVVNVFNADWREDLLLRAMEAENPRAFDLFIYLTDILREIPTKKIESLAANYLMKDFATELATSDLMIKVVNDALLAKTEAFKKLYLKIPEKKRLAFIFNLIDNLDQTDHIRKLRGVCNLLRVIAESDIQRLKIADKERGQLIRHLLEHHDILYNVNREACGLATEFTNIFLNHDCLHIPDETGGTLFLSESPHIYDSRIIRRGIHIAILTIHKSFTKNLSLQETESIPQQKKQILGALQEIASEDTPEFKSNNFITKQKYQDYAAYLLEGETVLSSEQSCSCRSIQSSYQTRSMHTAIYILLRDQPELFTKNKDGVVLQINNQTFTFTRHKSVFADIFELNNENNSVLLNKRRRP